jgi:hypothetical protein
VTLPLLKHPEVTPLNTTKPPPPYIAHMLARITSALTLFSMILVMLGSALHTHGSAHVYGAGHGDRCTNVRGATAIDAQCAGMIVDLLLARPAPQAEHVVHEVCIRVSVRAAGRAPPIC